MELKKYLKENKLSYTDFSKKVDVTSQTIRTACKGRRISFKNASKIKDVTNGQVGYQDLLPEIYIAVASEFLEKMKNV